jgi:energy-coupling factor transporter ATP-binding protein EcfA2
VWISRIRVTGGYLHGLDVALSRGLNVVVGPRGAGKTAFLEFLRHALAAEHADRSPEAERQRASFLRAVLGAGEIVVDVESDDGGRHLVVDAKGTGQRADLSRSVVVLGQNELEGIASDAPSRLNLLDLRTRPVATNVDVTDPDGVAHLTTVLYDIRAELEERLEEAEKRTRLLADQELLASQEAVLLGRRGSDLAEKRESLRAAEELVIGSAREHERIDLLRVELQQEGATSDQHLERLLSIVSRVPGVVEAEVGRAVEGAEQTRAALQDALAKLSVTSDELRDAIAAARHAAAPIREELEEAEAGLGQITGQLRNIDVALRSLDDNDARVQELRARQDEISSRRSSLLNEIEHVDELVFRSRLDVARATSGQVSANVVIVVEHLADTTAFRSFLQHALKGSSTRGVVIDAVADRVLPRQLLELVESRDAAGLAAASGLVLERAGKLVANLDDRDTLAGLARVRLEDMVDFRLRDGALDKSVDELSTGQKCSVTLPIVMSERDRSLILDQPEDHLDNAFLVSNVVNGLVSRTVGGAQTIVATHNANIPVLGAADNVVVLTSDGTTGAVDVQGPFDAPDVVDRITRIMEGGREAFARRSSFYSRYQGTE